jgi:hypothetical protein
VKIKTTVKFKSSNTNNASEYQFAEALEDLDLELELACSRAAEWLDRDNVKSVTVEVEK